MHFIKVERVGGLERGKCFASGAGIFVSGSLLVLYLKELMGSDCYTLVTHIHQQESCVIKRNEDIWIYHNPSMFCEAVSSSMLRADVLHNIFPLYMYTA